MSQMARRVAFLVLALGVLAAALAACASPAPPSPAPNNGGGVNAFHTPNPALQSPTPAFPAFTIGAWPSDYSPAGSGTVTIYVICRIQDPSMNSAPRPAAGQSVLINVGAPLNLAQSVTTGRDGLGSWTITVVDKQNAVPVVVTVTTNYNGQTYSANTFFTPSPVAPPSPTGGPNPTGSPTVTGPSPTSTP